MSALPLLVVLVPLALAALLSLGGRTARAAIALAPWAALPALLLAALPVLPPAAEYPWLLLGLRIGVDEVGRAFLLLAGLLWTGAGIYGGAYHAGDPHGRRLWGCWLLALAGNLGVAVARDVVGFYLFFALMTFAAYGLVVHVSSPAAFRAGRVYVAMAVLGEGLLLAGLLLATADAGGTGMAEVAASLAEAPDRSLAVGLLLSGLGVKAGALPLHVWLPLAHPVAPTPASAVLSGCMVKAGLLGWLRLLPLGEVALPGWGTTVMAAGVVAAFFGVLAGATQTDPKTALAYSTISQMGFVNLGIGIALAVPEAWPYALGAALLYALHHGVAKGALFLGVGIAGRARGRQRWAARAGLALAALAVAGAPLTSGSAAKAALKSTVELAPEWPIALDVALPLAAVGSSLLMGRVLVLCWRSEGSAEEARVGVGMWVGWGLLLAAVAGVLRAVPAGYALGPRAGLPEAGALWVSIWPLVAGAILLWAVGRAMGALPLPRERLQVAAGDVLVPAERVFAALRRRFAGVRWRPGHDPLAVAAEWWRGVYLRGERRGRASGGERVFARWEVVVLLFTALVLALAAALATGGAR